jgi:hypothetical protein
MLGNTKGTVISAFTSCFPGNDLLYKRYAPGIATLTVTIVDTAACHKVNQTIPRVFGCNSWVNQALEKPRRATSVTGQ